MSVKAVWNAFGQHMKALDCLKNLFGQQWLQGCHAAMVAIVGEKDGARWKRLQKIANVV